MRRLLFLAPAAVIVALDQITKYWCLNHLQTSVPNPWLDHVLYLTLVHNARGAFSLFPLPNIFFIGVVWVLLTGLCIYMLRSDRSIESQLLAGIIFGGGIGNLIDRFRFGYVIDFLDLRWWPVFNVADSAVSVGVVALFISVLMKRAGTV